MSSKILVRSSKIDFSCAVVDFIRIPQWTLVESRPIESGGPSEGLHSVTPFPWRAGGCYGASFVSVSVGLREDSWWPEGSAGPFLQWADPFQSPSAAFVATLIYQMHSPASGSNNASQTLTHSHQRPSGDVLWVRHMQVLQNENKPHTTSVLCVCALSSPLSEWEKSRFL